MLSAILIIFFLAQAACLVAFDGHELHTAGPIFLNTTGVFALSTVIIGVMGVGLCGDYISRLAFPRLGTISTLNLFIVVQWIGYLLGVQFEIWINQGFNHLQGLDLVASLIATMGIVLSNVSILFAVLASLVLGIELIVGWVISGGQSQLVPTIRPVLVLFGIAAISKVIGEFGLMIIR